jgi:uncharacterized RDD family membrane protein YckC
VSGGDVAEEWRSLVTVQAALGALAPAAIGARVIALIIDVVILGISLYVLGLIVGDVTIVGAVTRLIIFGAIGFLYYAYSWTTSRASPGQRFLGLMTVNAADGAALTWNQATMRWAYLFGPSLLANLFNPNVVGGPVSSLIGLVVLGYYIWLLYTTANDPKRQGLHDKQAGSLVVVKTAA